MSVVVENRLKSKLELHGQSISPEEFILEKWLFEWAIGEKS